MIATTSFITLDCAPFDRYLVKHPKSRLVIETPQYFFMRVACAVSDDIKDALELYDLFSRLVI